MWARAYWSNAWWTESYWVKNGIGPIPPVAGAVPVRYVLGVTANVVPVQTMGGPGIGVVPVREMVGPANVVPVRETSTEIPRVKVRKV